MSNAIYIGYNFKVEPLHPGTEILIAELGYAGFESFVENEDGVTAYIQKEEWRADILEDIQILKYLNLNNLSEDSILDIREKINNFSEDLSNTASAKKIEKFY